MPLEALLLRGPGQRGEPVDPSVGQVAVDHHELHPRGIGLEDVLPRILDVALEHEHVGRPPLGEHAQLVAEPRDLGGVARDHLHQPPGVRGAVLLA
jgi:hypothetical protein